MLSYQHSYHAGNAADIHKHRHLAEALTALCGRGRPLTYFETHAGRGLYDLTCAEAIKTGEAASGWLSLAPDGEKLSDLPPAYVSAVRSLNDGGLAPRYPGSPLVAAHILRAQDRLHLFELHPQEHAGLAEAVKGDRRVSVYRRDGYEGVLSLIPPPRNAGLVLVDPSYEIKEEYVKAGEFAVALREKWPQVSLLLWYPLLPAGRHEDLLGIVHQAFGADGCAVDEIRWAEPSAAGRGMYGSGIIRAGL